MLSTVDNALKVKAPSCAIIDPKSLNFLNVAFAPSCRFRVPLPLKDESSAIEKSDVTVKRLSFSIVSAPAPKTNCLTETSAFKSIVSLSKRNIPVSHEIWDEIVVAPSKESVPSPVKVMVLPPVLSNSMFFPCSFSVPLILYAPPEMDKFCRYFPVSDLAPDPIVTLMPLFTS